MAGALVLERMHSMYGSTAWCSQPSVLALVRDAGMPVQEALQQRIEEAFRPHLGAAGGGIGPCASLADVLSRLCVRLQIERGLPAFREVAPEAVQPGRFRIVVPTQTAGHVLTQRMVHSLALAIDALASGASARAALEQVGAALDLLARDAPSGKNGLPLLMAADKLGIPWDRMPGGIYRLGQGSKARWFRSSITDRTSTLGVALAKAKHDTASVLRALNIPAPEHRLARSEDEAVAVARKLGLPVVVKPADQDRGMGVASRLRTEDAVRRAWREAAQHSETILVEKHFMGEDHRIHVFEGEVFRVRHRVPGGVVGDGHRTVAQLLEALNADPERGPPGSNAELIRIDMDDEALDLLDERGMRPDSVPAAGDAVQLRRIANVSVGGVSHRVNLAEVHPDNLTLAVRAVAALKLDLAAVDFLIPDIRRSWMEVGAVVCEINAQPQFGEDAPEWIFARMFPRQGRIPIVAVSGACEWIPQVRRRARDKGVRLGYADATGTRVGDARISRELPRGACGGASLLVADGTVDAILVALDEPFARGGLPSDRFDLLIVSKSGDGALTAATQAVARASARVIADSAGAAGEALRVLAKAKAA